MLRVCLTLDLEFPDETKTLASHSVFADVMRASTICFKVDLNPAAVDKIVDENGEISKEAFFK